MLGPAMQPTLSSHGSRLQALETLDTSRFDASETACNTPLSICSTMSSLPYPRLSDLALKSPTMLEEEMPPSTPRAPFKSLTILDKETPPSTPRTPIKVPTQWQETPPSTPGRGGNRLKVSGFDTPPRMTQRQETPPSTPRRGGNGLKVSGFDTPPRMTQRQETPPSTPRRGGNRLKVSGFDTPPRKTQRLETPPSTPRRGGNSLKVSGFETPPRMMCPMQKEHMIKHELADAVSQGSMVLLTLALNRQTLEMGSLIHACVDGGHSAALLYALEHSEEDRDSINDPSPKTGQCPLEYAMHASQMDEMIKILLDYGADPNMACASGNGQTLLHKAAAMMHFPAVESLLAYGADPNCVDEEGCTPLHHMCKTAGRSCLGPPLMYYRIMDDLLAAGADPEHRNAAGFLADDYMPSKYKSAPSFDGCTFAFSNYDALRLHH